MTKKYLKAALIVLIFFLLSFRLWQVSGCLSFRNIGFEPEKIKLEIEAQRLYDDNPNSLIPKLAHNKFNYYPYDFSLTLSKTIEPRFLLDLIGPLGLLAAITAIFTIVSSKKKLGIVYIVFLICFQIAAILFLDPKIATYCMCILWFTLGIFSISFFSKNYIRFSVFFILFLYTIWFFFINWQFTQICNAILFK